jgi:Super-infection exclusion protein B
MYESLSKIIDWLKSPRQCAPMFIAALVVLRLEKSFTKDAFLTQHRAWVLLLAIMSGAVLVVELAVSIWQWLMAKRAARLARQHHIDYLRTLSPEEKGILIKYFISASNTQYFSTADGIVGGLVANGILFRSSGIGRVSPRGPIFAYNLRQWIREFVNDNPQILDGAEEPTAPPSPFRN